MSENDKAGLGIYTKPVASAGTVRCATCGHEKHGDHPCPGCLMGCDKPSSPGPVRCRLYQNTFDCGHPECEPPSSPGPVQSNAHGDPNVPDRCSEFDSRGGRCLLDLGHAVDHYFPGDLDRLVRKPASAGPVLTREEIVNLIDREGSCEPWEYRLLTHDAALRAEVEALRKSLAFEIKNAATQRARADKAEAEAERLRDLGMKAELRGDTMEEENQSVVGENNALRERVADLERGDEQRARDITRLTTERDKAEARVAGETLRGRIAECDAVAAWVIAAHYDGRTEGQLLTMLEKRQNESRRAIADQPKGEGR